MIYTIAAFYRFVVLEDLPDLKAELLREFKPLDLCGTLLLAPEGINGTMAGSAAAIETLLDIMAKHFGLPRTEVKFSTADEKPFDRLKIRLKREIITFRQPEADPNRQVGTYVKPEEWNQLLDDPEIVVVDTRNSYETMIGTFENALVPPIENFTEFADYVQRELDPARHKKIAMFCTGGIRCEKASAYMLAQGFNEVYHLQGGILKYLETVSPEDSRWHGACYVFDRRVAVGHGLQTGSHTMCFYCGLPLSEPDRQHPDYEAGVSCAHCHTATSEAQKEKLRARHRQLTGAI